MRKNPFPVGAAELLLHTSRIRYVQAAQESRNCRVSSASGTLLCGYCSTRYRRYELCHSQAFLRTPGTCRYIRYVCGYEISQVYRQARHKPFPCRYFSSQYRSSHIRDQLPCILLLRWEARPSSHHVYVSFAYAQVL